jgi:hypothetical protein
LNLISREKFFLLGFRKWLIWDDWVIWSWNGLIFLIGKNYTEIQFCEWFFRSIFPFQKFSFFSRYRGEAGLIIHKFKHNYNWKPNSINR